MVKVPEWVRILNHPRNRWEIELAELIAHHRAVAERLEQWAEGVPKNTEPPSVVSIREYWHTQLFPRHARGRRH